MRKLIAYTDSAFSFFKKVVSSKKNTSADPTYKERLVAMEGTLQPLFENYDNNFAINDLETLNAYAFTEGQREDLLKLYSYKSAIMQKLKIQLTTLELNQVLNTCQCCTIGEVGTFDHMAPKDEFPEFCVNPKNLFPCCSKCNSYKSVAWRSSGARTYLNLFLDDLPTEQYLFVALDVDHLGTVVPTFSINNMGRINARIYRLIDSHYRNLRLCARFKENSDAVITNVANSIRSGRNLNISKVNMIEQITNTSVANQNFLGANYWKSVLEISLAHNRTFIDSIYDNP